MGLLSSVYLSGGFVLIPFIMYFNGIIWGEMFSQKIYPSHTHHTNILIKPNYIATKILHTLDFHNSFSMSVNKILNMTLELIPFRASSGCRNMSFLLIKSVKRMQENNMGSSCL